MPGWTSAPVSYVSFNYVKKTNSVTLEKLGNNKLPKAKLIERNIYILFICGRIRRRIRPTYSRQQK